jgi:predicted AlkP superfamily pyrophosphatase or phosphodiesterase
MKKFRLTLLLAWGASAVFAAPRQVIVITLDGYPAYALRDPLYPAPALRRMIQEGAWAPEGMTPVNPAVTWPNHTSLLTGVDPAHHGVIYNGLPVRENGAVRIQWDVPKKELVLAKTVYDLAREKGMKTAEVDWPATDRAGIDFEFAEIPSAGSLVVKEMVKAGGLDDAGIENFRKQPIAYRDEIWTRAAIEIVRNHHPNLLLFHLLTTDSVQHRYGARSLAASAALALADRQVARLVEAVRESGAAAQTTFIVVSDHGFATAKRQIRPAALLRERGVRNVAVVSEGGSAILYGDVPAGLFRGVEGIARVITPAEFAALGYPAPGDRMGNLVLAAADGYAFSGSAEGPVVGDLPLDANPGNHGYLNTNPDMRPIFVAWGAGIRRGVRVENVRTVDIAPTIAHLLGLRMEGIQGRLVTGALK